MKRRTDEVSIEINRLKKALANLLNEKGKVDSEVLDLADQVDNLLNEYDRMLLDKDNNETQILMMLIELKDKQLLYHVQRLQRLITKISFTFKLSDEVMRSLLLLAQFHDVGKLGIPDSILLKKSPLTENEFVKMKQHSEIGHRITKASSELFNIAHLILKHHEWWNGEGYPLGLKGDEIPFECRILAIIDAFDAMTHSRPYRNAISHKEAIEELVRCAGTQFDPFIIRELKEIHYYPFSGYKSFQISWQ